MNGDPLLTLDAEEDHKALAQLLQHLKLPADLDDRMIIQLDLLLSHVKENGTTDDPTIDKALDKFQARFKKTYSKRLPDINRGAYLDEEMLKLYEYVEVDPPEAVIVASSSKTTLDVVAPAPPEPAFEVDAKGRRVTKREKKEVRPFHSCRELADVASEEKTSNSRRPVVRPPRAARGGPPAAAPRGRGHAPAQPARS